MALTDSNSMTPPVSGTDHHNNLTALRWFAACLVLYGHAFVFLGLPEPLFLQWVPMGPLGVYIFFAISGYLVAQSWQRDPNVPRFLAKRALRIFPGLLVCTLLSVLVLGPWLTTLDMATYWRNEHTRGYFTNVALYMTYHLPGVFAQNKLPHAVNGSLWSLPVEFFMYLLLAFLGLVGTWFQNQKWGNWLTALTTLSFMLLVALWALPSTEALVVYRTDLRQIPLCGVYFMVGVCLFQFNAANTSTCPTWCWRWWPGCALAASLSSLPWPRGWSCPLWFWPLAWPSMHGLASGIQGTIPTASTSTPSPSSKLWPPFGHKCYCPPTF